MYEIALLENDDDSIDIIASKSTKQHFMIDVVSPDDGDFYTLCKEMLDGEPAVYRTYFTFKTWQNAKKHYDLVVHKGFRLNFQRQYF
ncbi:MAG: hypothetical protein L3I99_08275 [Sulfurimonas sp.]|nr:hypothetical protein [Sulfurimonas sp.]